MKRERKRELKREVAFGQSDYVGIPAGVSGGPVVGWMRMMGADSVRYHRDTVLGRSDDHPGAALAYYASRGETPLRWGGTGAGRLGLSGHVTDETYEAIFGTGGARHPATGERLVRTTRPGLEVVISVHKSVAELGVIGRAEDMHRILDAERDGTIAYLERLTRDRGGRRGRAVTATPTSGLIYAITRHATSRDADPCLHDHVLFANLVEMLDTQGGWKAADTTLWRDHLHAATVYGRMCSAHVAVELGYGIVSDDGESGNLGHWAIAGIPDAAMKVHSKRSAEINDAVEVKGFRSYRARAVTARDTRAPKERVPVEDLMARWRQELVDVGLDLGDIGDAVQLNHARRITTELADWDLDKVATQLLMVDGPLAADKVFARRDVMVAAAPLLYGLDPSVLDRLVDKVLEHHDAIPLAPARTARDWRWAPRCIIETETKIAKKATERHDLGTAPTVNETFARLAIRTAQEALGHPLTDSQLRVVSGICRSGRSLDVVVGVAGSGKTTTLNAVQTALTSDGYRVLGTATSGQAARTLGREANLEAFTVASLLARLDRGTMNLDARTVVVLDEAGMTDDHDLLRLVEATTAARAKLVVVGDDRQLSAVGPGGSLAALVRRFGGGVWRLDDNIRQINLAEREALVELRSGDVEVAVDWMCRNDRIEIGADRPEAIGAMVDGWIADVDKGLDTVMLAWRRSSVDALNELARHAYEERGWLTGPELVAPGGRRYRAGDRIVTLSPSAGVVTSETGRVDEVDVGSGSLRVRFDDGRRTLLAAGFTSSNRLAPGYAITVHRAQGATVDTAHYLEDGGGRELAYVALSRARTSSTVYAVADDLDQATEDLSNSWTNERRQEWIIDQRQSTRVDWKAVERSGIDLG